MVESLKQDNEGLCRQVQDLRDEVNRLKGAQGKPNLPGSPKKRNHDHASERERPQLQRRRKSRKVDKIQVQREEKLSVERSQLPADVQFKGYEAVVVQELALQTANVRFLKEKFYSASRRQTWLAELPPGYSGHLAPASAASS